MGPVNLVKAIFRAVRGSQPVREVRFVVPKVEDAETLVQLAARAVDRLDAEAVREDTETELILVIRGEAAKACWVIRDAAASGPFLEGSYLQLKAEQDWHDGSKQWLDLSPTVREAESLASAEPTRNSLDSLRAEALRDVLAAFQGVTFPPLDHYQRWGADEFEMAQAILADRPWAELDPLSQPLYLPDSGRTDMVQPYAPCLFAASLMPGEAADPRLRGLSNSVLGQPALLAQLTNEQFQAAAKASVALAVSGEEPTRLEEWLYLCAVKMDALKISHKTPYSSPIETLMNLHLTAALSVETAPQAARLSALWVQAMRVLDDPQGLPSSDLVELMEARRASRQAGTWHSAPLWLVEQIEYLTCAAALSGAHDDLAEYWAGELTPEPAPARIR